MLERDGGAAG